MQLTRRVTLALAAPLALFHLAATPVAEGGGTVSYVTATEAYLDVGRADGVSTGATLNLLRRKRPVGTCEVTEVSAQRSRCQSDRVERGDRVVFTIVAPDPPATAPVLKVREPLPSEQELAERRALVQSAAIERVVHKRTSDAMLSLRRASTTLRQEVWSISTAPEGAFGRSSIDASALANVGLLPSAFAAASLRVEGNFIAPPDQRAINVYLWNASVGVDNGPWVGQLGRFRPKKAPGALLLDGAQIGARLLGDTMEVGAFMGSVPALLTTAPALDRFTAGSYLGLDIVAAPGVMLLPRASAGIVSTADSKSVRPELATQAQFLWTSVGSIGGSLRAGADEAGLVIDAASADADLMAIAALRLSASYHYYGASGDFDALLGAPPVGGAHHASALTAYQLLPGLVLGGSAGAGFDDVAGTVRGYAGPEIGLPRALGPNGGLAFGYLEELGDWPGRSAWVSAHAAQVSLLSVVTRLSYFETVALGDSFREAALMLVADAPLLPGVSIRGRGYLQQALPSIDGAARATPTLVMAELAITGAL